MRDHIVSYRVPEKPRLRGRLHQVAFLASIPAGGALVLAA
jgi:hypothetical protein